MIAWMLAAFLFGVMIYQVFKMHRKNASLEKDVEALEIGKDELQDTYEQQFLSHLEKISLLTVHNGELEKDKAQANAIIEYHARKCHGLVDDTIEQIMESLASTHDEPIQLVHNHPLYEGCDINNCKTDRYVDGVHQFTDVTVLSPAKIG